jgi:hypothetical protein
MHPSLALPADWTKVVDSIQLALTEALAEAADRAQTLEANPIFAEPSAPLPDGLQRLDERLQALSTCVSRAEQTAADVEALLETGQQAIAAWRTAADSLWEKLATWSRRSL